MGEIRKIITQNATAADLPERFRGSLAPDQEVIVTVTPVQVNGSKQNSEPASRGESKYLRYWGAAAHLGTTTEAAVARIRALRDEWDDR